MQFDEVGPPETESGPPLPPPQTAVVEKEPHPPEDEDNQ